MKNLESCLNNMNYYIIDLNDNISFSKVSKKCFADSVYDNLFVAQQCGERLDLDMFKILEDIKYNRCIDEEINAFQFVSTHKEWMEINDYYEQA